MTALPLSCWALVMCSAPNIPATPANPNRLHPLIVEKGWQSFIEQKANPWADAGYNIVVGWPSGCLPAAKPRILGKNHLGHPIPCSLRSARHIDSIGGFELSELHQRVTAHGKRMMLYTAPPTTWDDILDLPCTDIAWDARGSVAASPTAITDIWTRRVLELKKGVHEEQAPINSPNYDKWVRGANGLITPLPTLRLRNPRLHSPTNSIGRAFEWFCWIDLTGGTSTAMTPEERLSHAREWQDAGYKIIMEPHGFTAERGDVT